MIKDPRSEAGMTKGVAGMTRPFGRGRMTLKHHFKNNESLPKSSTVMNTKKLMKNAAATF